MKHNLKLGLVWAGRSGLWFRSFCVQKRLYHETRVSKGAIFPDKGTEVPSLSWDKGTTGQAQNLAMGRDGPGQLEKIWDGTRDGTITIFSQ